LNVLKRCAHVKQTLNL